MKDICKVTCCEIKRKSRSQKKIYLIELKRTYWSPCDVALWEWACQIIVPLENLADDFDIFRNKVASFVSICTSTLFLSHDSFPYSTKLPLLTSPFFPFLPKLNWRREHHIEITGMGQMWNQKEIILRYKLQLLLTILLEASVSFSVKWIISVL